MAKILKKLMIRVSREKDNGYIIEKPPTNQRILIKFRDKKSQVFQSSYSFIDKFTTNKGAIFIWNSYKSRSERINISKMDNGNYLIDPPKSLIVDAAFY